MKLEDHAARAENETELKRSLDHALRELSRVKKSKAELVGAVYKAVKDGISTLEIAPVAPPPKAKDPKKAKPEVAVAMVGDLQLGKVTPTYSSAMCEERMALYADKVLELTALQRAHHPVRELHVWMLGDLIEGVCLFPGQAFLVDSGLYRQITVDGPRILTAFLRKMLTSFDKVHVVGVIGNHGRIGKRGEYDPETNGDRMLMRVVQMLLADEKRMTWNVPDGMGERHWYAVDRIGNYSCMLFHGDQLGGRMQGALTMMGMRRLINGWKAGAIPEQFKDAAFGHWHQNIEVTLNGDGMARCNGSPESMNTFAQEALASIGRPSQRLMFVEPSAGIVTAEYKVWIG